ncbi:MAG: glycosyltransferase [Candidatus Scalindua sp.]|nr:glycosyltransferase [Candidatus Scalindua sp.]
MDRRPKNPLYRQGGEIQHPDSPDPDPTISLCMIVKDEEEFLPRCLESVKDHVDEIVIVDTGSTDRTVEIAGNYGATMYHHAWENSFCKARNFSLQYATSDWILILDADEEIEREDAHKLKEVIKDSKVNVISVPLFCKPLGGRNISISRSNRLFRNHLGIHYEGIVHNFLKYTGPTKNAPIKIYHYGYSLEKEKMEKKIVRTTALLKEQIKKDPLDPIPHYNLAVSYSYQNKQMEDECIREALEAIKLFDTRKSDRQTRLQALYTASNAFLRKKDLENAEIYALKALHLYYDYLDIHNVLSSIYFQRKEYDKSLAFTHTYLRLLKEIESDPTRAIDIPFITIGLEWFAYSRISIIYYEQDRGDEGEMAMRKAATCAAEIWLPYLAVGKYFYEQKNSDLGDRFLKIGLQLEPHNRDLLYQLAEIYVTSGLPDKALVHLETILNAYPEEILAQYHLGLIFSHNNQFDKAIQSFTSVIKRDPGHTGALFNLALVYEKTGDTIQAEKIYHALLETDPEYADVYIRLGSLYLNESDYVKAKECFAQTVKLNRYPAEAYLALSKISLCMQDLEGCLENCNELLKTLHIPGNITINSLSDLSSVYGNIGAYFRKQKNGHLADYSLHIAEMLTSLRPAEKIPQRKE